MASFSSFSRQNLRTCHPSLVLVFEEVVKQFDCRVTCGHRSETDQMKAYHEGRSTKQWPESKHNRIPSLAVDVVPYPVDWEDVERFYLFAGYVKGIAHGKYDIKIRWGGDWDSDTEVHDQTFFDLPHFEVII